MVILVHFGWPPQMCCLNIAVEKLVTIHNWFLLAKSHQFVMNWVSENVRNVAFANVQHVSTNNFWCPHSGWICKMLPKLLGRDFVRFGRELVRNGRDLPNRKISENQFGQNLHFENQVMTNHADSKCPSFISMSPLDFNPFIRTHLHTHHAIMRSIEIPICIVWCLISRNAFGQKKTPAGGKPTSGRIFSLIQLGLKLTPARIRRYTQWNWDYLLAQPISWNVLA